jgi:MHS family dicarboxylic acid transporter PcaT-like MFS transporter/MHS family alpha-ketoglutarate permease-like MFS transporter
MGMLQGASSMSAARTQLERESKAFRRKSLRYPRSFFTVLGFTAGGSKMASAIMTAVLACYMLLQPVFGALSDRIDRRNSMLCFRSRRASAN